MKDRTCSVEGCERSNYAKSWCNMHYTRWRRHGDIGDKAGRTPVANVLCSVDGCDKWAHAKSFCPMHYVRLRAFGSLDDPIMPTVEERFLAKVHKTATCWLWQASTDGKGYGQMRITVDGDERLVQAHRLSHELFVGKIPDGKVVDHICHVVNCVNPDHLRAVDHKQNMEHRIGAGKNSKTGVLGVSPRRKGYRATVRHNGHHFYLGTYSTIAEAEAVVIAKRLEVFTHNDLDRQ